VRRHGFESGGYWLVATSAAVQSLWKFQVWILNTSLEAELSGDPSGLTCNYRIITLLTAGEVENWQS